MCTYVWGFGVARLILGNQLYTPMVSCDGSVMSCCGTLHTELRLKPEFVFVKSSYITAKTSWLF